MRSLPLRTVAYWLVLVMVFTLPWENELDVPGIGRVSKVVGLLVAVTWVAAVVSSRQIREPRPVHVWALLFVLWNACTLMWTVDGPATQARVLTYAQLLGLVLVLWDTVTTDSEVRAVLAAYLAGCYVSVASLLGGYAVHGAASEVHGRVTVGNFHPNDLGMILALGVPVVGYLLHAAPACRWQVVRTVALVAYVPLAGFGVLITGSRAGLAAMLPGLVFLGYLVGRRRPGVALGSLVALILVAVAALPFAPERATSRLAGTGAALESGDLNERTEVWGEALRIIADHPVFGVGGGAFKAAAVGVNKVGHNFVLALLAEVGVIGFTLFATMLVTALLSLRRIGPPLRGMWIAIFTSWLFAALLHNWEYRKQTWLFIGLVVACGALTRRDEEEAAETEPASTAPGAGP